MYLKYNVKMLSLLFYYQKKGSFEIAILPAKFFFLSWGVFGFLINILVYSLQVHVVGTYIFCTAQCMYSCD